MWNVEGKRVYRVEITLPDEFRIHSSNKEPLKQAVVSCTCPDAFKRKNLRRRLCKHARSCFLSIVDEEADKLLKEAKKQSNDREVKETTEAIVRLEEKNAQEEMRIEKV